MATKSSFKNMSLCLLVICFVCSALLAGVFALTKAPIEAAAQAKLTKAISAVVPQFETLSELQSISLEGKDYTYYTVADASGEVVGYAINASTVGFGGPLSLMVGVTSDGCVYNTAVLSHSETPGLGAKCEDEAFYGQFEGWNPAEKTLVVSKDGGDVDAITASTITSRAYTLAVANAVKVFAAICAETCPEQECCETCDETNEEGGQDND